MKIELQENGLTYNINVGDSGHKVILCAGFVYKILGGFPEKIILTLSLERFEGSIEACRKFHDVVQTGGLFYGLFYSMSYILYDLIGNYSIETMIYFKIEEV